jgi:hypothetical protein
MPSLNFNIKNGLSIGVGATILNTVNTNIGIGKTNPTNKLDIVGGVSATFVASGSNISQGSWA